jgi:LysM repeat protein
MNTPNPLVPQGSLQEQSKRKSQIRIIVFSILAIHVVLLGALLIQGCKREDSQPTKIIEPPPLPPITDTNPPPPPPPPLTISNPPPIPAISNPPPLPPPGGDLVPPANATEHTIAKGETFGILAKKYGVSIKAIQTANPGVDSTKLKIGQKINIPPKPPGDLTTPKTSATKATDPEVAAGETLYVVKKADTLTKIAKAHGISIKALRAANNLRTDQLKPGQKLKLPAKAGAPVAPPPAPAPALPAPTGLPASMPPASAPAPSSP